jgi:hypothetical protein
MLIERHQRAMALQQRICEVQPPLPQSIRALHQEVQALLREACEHRLLRNPMQDVFRLVRLKRDGVHWQLTGGEKDFRRDRSSPCFERADGAWFDFAMTVREERRGILLLAYNFEVRFPDGTPRFLRYELNLPGHDNEGLGLRAHCHPGHDDIQAPAPLLGPLELLDVFIHGLLPRDPAKRRV